MTNLTAPQATKISAVRSTSNREPRERPILFTAEMVRAILEGRKTQTRRVVKPQPVHMKFDGEVPRVMMEPNTDWRLKPCPYGKPGDHLWVRETWCYFGAASSHIGYKATDDICEDAMPEGWKSPLFMPRAASRILLEVVSVRVERVRDISEKDAQAEGTTRTRYLQGNPFISGALNAKFSGEQSTHRTEFMILWDSINGKKHPWESNPWVWVIEFKRSAS